MGATAREPGSWTRALVLCGRLARAGLPLLLLAACGEGGPWQLGISAREAADEPPRAVVLPQTPSTGGTVHIIRLTARGDRYAFEPAEVQLRPGDVLRFIQTDYQPESIAFDTTRVPPVGADFLRVQGVSTGPLLTQPGAVYDIDFRDAPEGTYPFSSIPHAQLGMRGAVVVRRAEAAAVP